MAQFVLIWETFDDSEGFDDIAGHEELEKKFFGPFTTHEEAARFGEALLQAYEGESSASWEVAEMQHPGG